MNNLSKSLVIISLALILAPSIALAWPENGVVTIQMLIDGEITLEEMVEHEVSMDQLLGDLSEKEKKAFLRKNKKKIVQLKKTEKGLVKAHKKAKGKSKKKNKNKHYFGEPELAEDADEEQLEQYAEIINTLKGLFDEELINESTLKACLETIESLEFFHANNRQINIEFSQGPVSETYGQERVSLHPAEKDAPFHLKATLLLSWLKSIFEFARGQEILPAMFTDGLSKNNGCLEARIRTLQNWHKNRAKHLRKTIEMSPNSKANSLPKLALEVVYGHLERNYDFFSKQIEIKDYDVLALEIEEYFIGKKDSEGKPISREDALVALKALFISRSPLKEVLSTSKSRSGSSARRKISFEQEMEDAIDANRASLDDIDSVQTVSGRVLGCKIVRVKSDGNCGFSALGSVTRQQFIKDVHGAFRDSDDPHLLDLIGQAMQEIGAQNILDWVRLFSSPSVWMSETVMRLYAYLYDVRVEVHALDHERNIFMHVMTINENGARTTNLVHINLDPIHGENEIALNHYDQLIILEDGDNEELNNIQIPIDGMVGDMNGQLKSLFFFGGKI